MRQIIVSADDYQGSVMVNLLRGNWDGAEHYAIRRLPYWLDNPELDDPDAVAVVMAQIGHSVHAEHRIGRLLRRLPADVRVIRFPVLSCPVLWPFALRIVKPWLEPGFDKPRFAWGDRCIIDLVHGGLQPNEALEQYLAFDIPAIAAVDQIFDRWMHRFRQLEEAADVSILDFLLGVMSRRRTFVFHDDVERFAVQELLNRILAALRLPKLQASADALPKRVHKSEMPVHPSLIEHFGLEYLKPSYAYAMPWGGRLTHREWVKTYIDHLVAEQQHTLSAGVAP